MDDKKIIELFFKRSENALKETESKYGTYCSYIANNILCSNEDSEECTNDALISVWNSIPPQMPTSLKAYIGRITRNLALNRIKAIRAEKRGGGAVIEAIDELKECACNTSVEQELDAKNMKLCIDGFVRDLKEKQRTVFVKRYWYMCTAAQIAKENGMTENAVNVMLHRLRGELKRYLESEGYDV